MVDPFAAEAAKADEEFFAEFDKIGESEVRFMLGKWGGRRNGAALRWLDRQERRNKRWVQVAAGAAVVAAVIALLSWIFPVH
jgi:hypothetical protein